MTNLNIQVFTITPGLAEKWLENNPANRGIRKFHAEAIARDMKAGRWQTNGDAIRLNGDGSLIDGQHRLLACVLSGVPFETVVISGLPSEVRATIDGNAKRTHGDRLAMLGVANANRVSATARMVAQLAVNLASARLSSQELDRVLELHPGIHHSVKVTGHAPDKTGRIVGAIHYVGTSLGYANDADSFVHVIKSGIPAYPGDAAHAFRERMIKHRGALTRYSDNETARAAVCVWRHFITRTPVKQIKFTDLQIAGWTPEKLGL